MNTIVYSNYISQLTLFPSGDNESPKNSRITVNLYG